MNKEQLLRLDQLEEVHNTHEETVEYKELLKIKMGEESNDQLLLLSYEGARSYRSLAAMKELYDRLIALLK